MPDCEDCGEMLGIWERGTICPVCHRLYNFIETAALPHYNAFEFLDAVDLFRTLYGMGVLGRGKNKVNFFGDGLEIERLGDS